MTSNQQEIKYLLEKYSGKRATPDEITRLFSLISQSTDDETIVSYLQDQLQGFEPTDEEEIAYWKNQFNGYPQTITAKEVPVRKVSFSGNWWWAAAAVLILVSGVFLWFSNTESKEIAQTSTQQGVDVSPGKQGAILTLDDGRELLLDSMGNGIIVNEKGSRAVLENGQLAYKNIQGINPDLVAGYHTMTTPNGRQFQLELPDGTKVWLNAASSIRYPTTFTGKERKVQVTGEAYFEVVKRENAPFLVDVDNRLNIEVLGTHFNVNAYTNEKVINTTLLEGLVKVVLGPQQVTIKPGEQAQALDKIKVFNEVDIDQVTAWKNGVFNFEEVSLEEAMRQLARWYDIEIIYANGIPDIQFFGKIRRDVSLAGLVKGLEAADVHFRIEKDRKLIVLP